MTGQATGSNDYHNDAARVSCGTIDPFSVQPTRTSWRGRPPTLRTRPAAVTATAL